MSKLLTLRLSFIQKKGAGVRSLAVFNKLCALIGRCENKKRASRCGESTLRRDKNRISRGPSCNTISFEIKCTLRGCYCFDNEVKKLSNLRSNGSS